MKERDLSELRRASDEYELVRPLEDAERKPRAQHRRDTVRIGDEEATWSSFSGLMTPLLPAPARPETPGVSGEERLEVVPPLGVAHRAAKELLEDRARRLSLLVSDEADTCDE